MNSEEDTTPFTARRFFMGPIRRIVVFTVVVPLALTGIPLPAHAASSEETLLLTFNGRPLSELLHGQVADAFFPLPTLRQQDDGQIRGVVVDEEDGQPVADQRVELRRPASAGPGRLVAVTDTNGQFVYGRLGPGRYEVELRVEGQVLATSGPVELSAGSMHRDGVTIARPAAPRPTGPLFERGRMNADQLLRGQSVPESFGALRSILEPGHEVQVADETGRATRGKVVSISSQRLVISRPRFFWRAEELAFTTDRVSTIDIIDPIWNGALIGAGIGVAATFATCQGKKYENRTFCFAFAGPAFLVVPAIAVGALVDRSINDSIYERPSQGPRVTIAPSFGRGVMGVSAHVSF
jgi:hypothetical protein